MIARERSAAAELIECIAEVDARALFLPAGYPPMIAYCVGEFHLSPDAAFKRIQVARAARDVPAILAALADGRLHLTGAVPLAPHVTAQNVDELIGAATLKTTAEIEWLLAERFPRTDSTTQDLELVPTTTAGVAKNRLVSKPVEGATERAQAPPPAEPPSSRPAPPPALRSRITPPSAEEFELRLTMQRRVHEKLRHARELLGHKIPSGDLEQVIEHGLDLIIREDERRKFAATSKPRPPRSASNGRRRIPASVRRAVAARDGRQCAFIDASGRRCPARTRLEFHHVHEFARDADSPIRAGPRA